MLRAGLLLGGGAMLLIGFLFGGAALYWTVERVWHGRSAIVADFEVFGVLALICCVLGAFSLIVARRIARQLEQDKR